MERAILTFSLLGVLILGGCADYSRNDKVIQSIQDVSLIDLPGFAFDSRGGGGGGGSIAKLGELEIIGEIVSTSGKPLPPHSVDRIAQKIKTHLQKEGCVITGAGSGGGIHYTEASHLENCNLEQASVYYTLSESNGRVDIRLIERDYKFQGKNIVAQLVVTIAEAR